MRKDETFRTHPDLPIEVSNYGKVKKTDRWHPLPKEDYYSDKKGDLRVKFTADGKVYFEKVIDLFMAVWLPDMRLTSFKDGNKHHISLDNIRCKPIVNCSL